MVLKKEKLSLPEGLFDVDVIKFDKSDKKTIIKIYEGWKKTSDLLNSIKGRGLNFPEGLSEPIFCLVKNCVRVVGKINKSKSSFDCYDLVNKKRIQVKACSVIPDLTSFGPKSVWDEIYFMDFYSNGLRNGEFKIYQINTNDIYNYKVNANETMQDLKNAGKRPRFSIYTGIIKAQQMQPLITGNIYSL